MASHHPFRLIVFDFDGTLVDSQDGIFQAMAEAFSAKALPKPEKQAVRRVVGLPLETAVACLLPEDSGEAMAQEVAEGYRAAFVNLRSRTDYHEPLFSGAREALEALDQADVCLGIATGKGRRGLLISLERLGLSRHFATLQTADDAPGKPNPEVLRRAMAETGAEPNETVLIGDTTFDMETAYNAGVCALGVSWGYHEREELLASGAVQVLDSFADLLPNLNLMSVETQDR